ncbi:MAG: ABC transporter permease [Clostridiales bacterium]|nr:ABC transporter permease [Clostridiales bacterium]
MLWENVVLAWDALKANLLRTLLTLLGIVVGVAAVIAVVAIGRGGQAYIIREISSLGSGMVWVEPNWSEVEDFQKPPSLRPEDLKAMEALPGVAEVSPLFLSSLEAASDEKKERVQVNGVASGYSQVRNLKLKEGRFFTPLEVERQAPVVVVSQRVADDLWPRSDPVGKTLWLEGKAYTVIGTLAAGTGLQASLGAAPKEIYIPYTSFQRQTGQQDIQAVFILPSSPSVVNTLMKDIQGILNARYGKDTFTVQSLEDLLGAIRNVTNIMTLIVGSIAGIALLVGGIGIMNIMLVSVTERTREIGLRKAIGARRQDILWQFLIESVVVSSLGGIIGILLGAGIVTLVSRFTSLPSLVTPGSVLLAFSFSALVGIIFGVYPAFRAAQLDPIEALRYE